MKTREFISLAKRLLPALPTGFVVKEPMMFISPVEHTLRGIHFERSGFDARGFYAVMFFMPLCVPVEHVHFAFGRRIGRAPGEWWEADSPNAEARLTSAIQEVAPFLVSLQTMKDVAQAIRPLTKVGNPHCNEAFAYSLARAGETAEAIDALDNFLGSFEPTAKWETDIASRARLLRDRLVHDPVSAQKTLAEWQAVTIRNLGLEEYCK